MSGNTSLTLPKTTMERAEALLPYMRERFEGAGLSRARVAIMALSHGLRHFEEEERIAAIDWPVDPTAEGRPLCPVCGAAAKQDNRSVLLSWSSCPNGHKWDNPNFRPSP